MNKVKIEITETEAEMLLQSIYIFQNIFNEGKPLSDNQQDYFNISSLCETKLQDAIYELQGGSE